MRKILILKGQSQYNVLRYWTDELVNGFEKLGVEVILVDLLYCDTNTLKHFLNLEYDAILSFNGYLLEYEDLQNIIKVPYIYLLADHPIDHIQRINNLRDKDILTVVDRNDKSMLDKLCNVPKHTFMLPHAAQEIAIEKNRKEIDVLFTGTYSNPELFSSEWAKMPPKIREICDEAVQNCISNSQLYYISEFLKLFNNRGLEIDLKEQGQLLVLLRLVGRYIYSYRRLEVIKVLVENDVKLTIYGNGWDQSPLANHKNIIFEENVNYWEAQDIMKRSKIVLNIAGIACDGTHERVFSGMASRSVLVTNETPYLKEMFKDNEEIMFYNFDNLNSLPKKITSLLSNDEMIENISQNGKQAIIGKHTWFERAKEIKEIYSTLY